MCNELNICEIFLIHMLVKNEKLFDSILSLSEYTFSNINVINDYITIQVTYTYIITVLLQVRYILFSNVCHGRLLIK